MIGYKGQSSREDMDLVNGTQIRARLYIITPPTKRLGRTKIYLRMDPRTRQCCLHYVWDRHFKLAFALAPHNDLGYVHLYKGGRI